MPAAPAGDAVATTQLITFAASIPGCDAITSATTPDTMGVDPLVPSHCTYVPPGTAPSSCSLGAETPMVMPCDDASLLAFWFLSTPATVRTPGMVAGAPTSVVPLPRFPAAATITTLCCIALRNALSQLSGQASVLRVSDMLMMLAPWATA